MHDYERPKLNQILKATMHLANEIWYAKKNGASTEFVVVKSAAMIVDFTGKIIFVGSRSDVPESTKNADLQIIDHGDSYIVPGFVDAHLHCPQLDVIGSGGLPLLEWLDRYVFPAEMAFVNQSVAKRGAQRLSRELRRHGVTTAAVFSSVHSVAVDELFQEFENSGLRLIAGKTSMDAGAPDELLQCVDSDVEEQGKLIAKWHGKNDRLFYAITPRFALSCSPKMLRQLGELKSRAPSCFVQTHISENLQEVSDVKSNWSKYKDYLAVYEDHGLLDRRTLLAHGIHLTESELSRIAKSGATVVHCPTSNTFLGSGLFDLRRSEAAGVRVCLASDIGAGTSLSPWQTMLESYKVQALQGAFYSAGELLYRATLAGAEALGMDQNFGSLEVGKSADFVVINSNRNLLLSERLMVANTPEERLFAFMTYGDDRVVEATYAFGREVYRNH